MVSEQDTAPILAFGQDEIRAGQQRRIRNIKLAYEYALSESAKPGWQLGRIHPRRACGDLPRACSSRQRSRPIARQPEDAITVVGDEARRRTLQAAQFCKEIAKLLDCRVRWHFNERVVAAMRPSSMTLEQLRERPWLGSVYGRLTPKTLRRDLAGRVECGLLVPDGAGWRAPR